MIRVQPLWKGIDVRNFSTEALSLDELKEMWAFKENSAMLEGLLPRAGRPRPCQVLPQDPNREPQDGRRLVAGGESR